MRVLYRALFAVVLSGCLLLPLMATAAINTVVATPPTYNIAMNQASAVTITWRIDRGAPGTTAGVSSPNGLLTIAGTSITINRQLFRPTMGTEDVIIVETLVIPRSLLVRAIKSGGALTGTYVRIFTDGVTATGVANFNITTGGAADFGISRLTLKFLDDDSRATVRAVDTRLRAVARIRFTGTGLLQASWQIATPTSTPGNELFRPLRLERRQLTGNGEVELISPPLPTKIEGQYLVILSVEDPGLGFDTPRLIYTILPPGAPLAGPLPQSILVSAPTPEGALATGTQIAWSPSPAAVVYRILLIEAVDGPLTPPRADLQYGAPTQPSPLPGRIVTGFYMPATATQAVLPALVANRLTKGQRYLLQIQALDGAGNPVAESRPQEVYWP
jgi:hypothetical protein